MTTEPPEGATTERSTLPGTTDPIAELDERLAALDRAYPPGNHGLWSARRRAELFDDALARSFDEVARPHVRVAIAAVGGYGRMQQLPRSDVDLLVVHEGDHEEVASLVERLFYRLWDAGFHVGHAVRTSIECERIARERLDALTSMLDLRRVAGESALVDETKERVLALAAENVPGLARSLEADAAEREARFGSAAHLLEPDLKQGAGGLRDVQATRWITAVAGDAVLRTAERTTLEAAEEFLTRARSALQFESGKRGDRLRLDLQPALADAMGFTDRPGLLAEDGLMRAVFEHARTVRWIGGNVLSRVANGVVMPTEAAAGFAGVDEVLDAIASLAESGEPVSPPTLDAIEATPIGDPVVWTDGTRRAFLRIVRAEEGQRALEVLDHVGLLTRLLPAWAEVRCRPQRDPYHRFSVDTHLIATLAEMRRLLSDDAGSIDDDPLTADVPTSETERDGLLLGALLHDIGKTGEGGHVAVGVRVAAETLDHMGIAGPARDMAEFVVGEHLLLPDTATRRDLSDEHLILDVAARVGSPERLAALALLAKADAVATGPAAWTAWRQTLLRELVTRIRRVYDRGDMGTALAQRLSTSIDAVRDRLSAEPDEAVERFVLRMPQGYFLSVDPDRIAAHYPTIAPDVGSTEVRSAARRGTKPGTYELLVVAADRPGLLSWIAGAVALAGLSILGAQIFTADDGVAVDLFEVEGLFETEVDERRWREFRALLRKAVEGRNSLDHRVAAKRAMYRAASDAPVTVVVDNETSDYSTVIEVGGPDRIGLLYDITSALAELTLDVHLAKVATYAGRVVDVFYARDALGRKVSDPAQIAEIEATVRARLER